MTLGFDEFAWVGQVLGLSLSPAEDSLLAGSLTLDGTVDGVLVHAHHWRGQYVHLEITAYLDPPADFTFRIHPAGLFEKIASFLGGHDVEVGEPVFDAAYEVGSEEPDRARALLTPAFREVLMAWKNASHFDVREDRVAFWTIPGSYSTMGATVLRDAIKSVAGLARAASLALPGVPPSARLAGEIAAWRTHAEQHGLTLTTSPLRLVGKLGGSVFAARVVAKRDAPYGVELNTRFEEPLPFYLQVEPASFRDVFRSETEGTRIKTGDRAFDDVFRMVAAEPEKANAFLDEELRGALLGLHAEEGELALRGDGISIRTKRLVPPEAFERIVDRLAAVGEKLQRRAGPYR